VKEEGGMKEYVGCGLIREGKRAYMHQPELIWKIENTFEEDLQKSNRVYETPGSSGVGILRPMEGGPTVCGKRQTKYRSGVGMLLFLVKYSRPDIVNSVQELSKVNDGATEAHFKELVQCIIYVINTRARELTYSPIINENKKGVVWSLAGYCDSDFAGDKDGRISVTGFCIYVCGCMVSWKSRGQKSVTLSSTEAEYVAVSELCQEIMFVRNVLIFLGVEIKIPITMYCNNVGTIFLAYNAKTGGRTKHVDIRYHYVREFVQKGEVQILFVRSENNDSEIFTKNTAKKTFDEHSVKFMGTTSD
jgi:hypothetical protein